MSANSLLDKFDNIVISDKDLIPAEDIDFLNMKKEAFDKTLGELNMYLLKYTQLVEAEKNTCYSLYSYWDDTYKVRKEFYYPGGADIAKGENPYDVFRFSHTYSVAAIYKLRVQLVTYFMNTCMQYFSSKYQLAMDLPDYSDLDILDRIKLCTIDNLLDLVKTSLNGTLDLKAESRRQVVERVNDFWAKYEPSRGWRCAGNKPELKNKTVTFFDIFFYNDSSNSKFLQALYFSINLFEFNETVSEEQFSLYIITGMEYETKVCQRLVSYKSFKNGKFILKFNSSESAKLFIKSLNIDYNEVQPNSNTNTEEQEG